MRGNTEQRRRQFDVERRQIDARLCTEPAFRVFDAMREMCAVTELYLLDLADPGEAAILWTGGSLGRREMLPNSDVDLFFIRKEGVRATDAPRLRGFDKVDLGRLTIGELRALLEHSLIDANRFIDGRALVDSPLADVVHDMIATADTPDRQLSNMVSEHFYYRFFDFPAKRSPLGANLKYSSGSARVTLFFDFHRRMVTGERPSRRGGSAELDQALSTAEPHLAGRAPRRAVDLVLTVKNAAMSAFYATGDDRVKHVSRRSFEAVYEVCRPKLRAWGIRDAQELLWSHQLARRAIEDAVEQLIRRVIAAHPLRDDFAAIAQAPTSRVRDICDGVVTSSPEHVRSVFAFGAWQLATSSPTPAEVSAMAAALMARPITESWGGLMAVACCGQADDTTLARLTDWLASREVGAYLSKIVARNPAASPATRHRAAASHLMREVVTAVT
jgi:hypothetical protein